MDKNQDNKTRRGFLDKGVKIGAMAAVGSLAFMKIFRSNAKESTSEVATVELMSPEGTLMQVPASEVEAVPDKKTDYNPREGSNKVS